MNLNEAAGGLLVKFTDDWRSGEMAHALDNRVSTEEDLVKPQINKINICMYQLDILFVCHLFTRAFFLLFN